MEHEQVLENGCCTHCAGEHGHSHSGENPKREVIRLAAGAVVFGLGVVLSLYIPDVYIRLGVFLLSYVILGGGVLLSALKNIIRGSIFDENFLMCIATIGAFVLGEYPEAVAVMMFYQIGEYFQELAVRRSKKSITGLMDIRPDYANLKNGGEISKVPPEAVKVGDMIVVRPGEKIPLDGIVRDGESSLDTRALTGESMPRFAGNGDTALAGCVNLDGALVIEVTKPFGESTAARIIELVENASGKKAPAERFITKFSKYYTPAVVLLAALTAAIPPLLFGAAWAEWTHRGLVFLVISCPCALVLSVPLAFFGGIGCASRNGILIKGGNYLEALNSLDIVAFDKTGTLTKGTFEVSGITAANGYTESGVLDLAARAEAFSTHPVAQSVLRAYGKTPERSGQYRELAGRGVSVTDNGTVILAGNSRLMTENGVEVPEGSAAVYVAVDGVYAGKLEFEDSVRGDSAAAITGLKASGARKAVMLTGDGGEAAAKVAAVLPLDGYYSQLLPHEKIERLEELDTAKRRGGKLAFVGDGINDAPVLARADIGVAMGGLGSDAAIEAADIVLMTDEPFKLVTAVEIAAKTRRVVWQNIIFALGVKAAVLALGALGYATMWEAVFADVGVSLLAVLNSVRLMGRS